MHRLQSRDIFRRGHFHMHRLVSDELEFTSGELILIQLHVQQWVDGTGRRHVHAVRDREVQSNARIHLMRQLPCWPILWSSRSFDGDLVL
jgi:hypothetical protein